METRQCWAYNKQGHRCLKKATHRGDHSWSITWTDDECTGAPLIDIFAESPLSEKPIPLQLVTQQDSEGCVACRHRHVGECGCGCKEFI